ncbi:MAG: ATP-grasp domain-containing protein, partial [Candidatus Omnitrophica bacterium]|nr:ATP-grasp domain-containing protein [Candidatus Omnitrophota bacterium]
KTVHGGYDGKGQCIVRDKSQALKVFNSMKRHPLVWEKKIPFLKELSIIAARDVEGNVVVYPVSENMHIDNILDTAIVPARISRRAQNTARKIAETVALHLDIVGVFCVEMFLLEKDEILVNEIAPRPHNSGHYTINACPVSQFEQQLRAICGLSLGLPLLQNPAVMVNVLGTGKGNRLIGVDKMLGDPRIHFHLYGKEEAKTKRKMGHITAVAKSVEEALEAAEAARRKLRWAGSL